MPSNATIYRLRPAGPADRYGDPNPAALTRTLIDGAFVAPRTSGDIEDRGRSGVVVGLTLFAPHGTDLVHTDKVEVDGTVYDLDGDPGSWLQPHTGWAAGIEAALKRGAG